MNPPCPHCQETRTLKCGKNSADTQRYKCPGCSKKFVENPKPPTGAKPIGDRPLTNAEHQKRWYDSLSPEERSLHMEVKVIRRRELRAKKRSGNHGSRDGDSDRAADNS
jgi:transposase-like protein